jgi:hypothetical protein
LTKYFFGCIILSVSSKIKMHKQFTKVSLAILAISILVFIGSISGGKEQGVEPVAETPKLPGTLQELIGNTNNTSLAFRDKDSESSTRSTVPVPTAPITIPKGFGTALSDATLINDVIVSEDGTTYPLRTYKTLAIPNDPNANQWWVASTGASNAWDIGYGSNDVTLAIIDTGFGLNHQEFAGRWHTNSGESGSTSSQNPSRLNCTDRTLSLNASCNLIDDNLDGIIDNESGLADRENPSLLNCTSRGIGLNKSCNLIDDDNNGYIDDVTGWDFTSSYPSVQAGKQYPMANSNTSHGTMVAGVAAATGNNGIGLAGANWYSKILPLQAIDDDGYGNTLTISRAIRYAADQGAKVISISLGSDYPDNYMRQAVQYAMSKGSIVVAAAGNDGCNCMVYPAAYEEVLAVGAIDSTGSVAYFSSYGSALDVVAPGSSMRSTTWLPTNGASAYVSGIAGTSFATPFVAGYLSLALSHQPDATPLQLVAALGETNNKSMLGGLIRTNTSGYGTISSTGLLSRVTAPLEISQISALTPVSHGTAIGVYEQQSSNIYPYSCPGNSSGSLGLYRLTKVNSIIYTVSLVERFKAVEQGYSSSLFADGLCVNLPTDNPVTIRTIDIFQEFENRVYKP